jgi:hypothetical protein
MTIEQTVAPEWLGSLDRVTLTRAASEQVGLTDFGDDRFIEPLDRFLEAARSEAHLSETGFAALSMDVVRLLVNRLLHRRDQVAHPEMDDEDVSDPLVITGLVRTGTTKLQRLLARDPGWQSLPLWKALLPAPPPGSEVATGTDPRIAQTRQQTDMLAELFPGFMAAHPMLPEEPEEEILLIQMTFEARGTALMYRVPSYVAWLDERPGSYQFEYLRDMLRYLQWQDGGRRDRPWLLKSPPPSRSSRSVLRDLP